MVVERLDVEFYVTDKGGVANLNKAKEALDGMGKNVDKSRKAVDGAGKDFKKFSDDTGNGFEALGTKIAKFATGAFLVTKAVGVITDGFRFLWAEGQRSVQVLDSLTKSADQFGLSIKTLASIQLAGSGFSTSDQDINSILQSLSLKYSQAAGGDAGANELFGKISISVNDSAGRLKEFDAVMREVFLAFKDGKQGANEMAIAQELFGRATRSTMGAVRGMYDAMNTGALKAEELQVEKTANAYSAWRKEIEMLRKEQELQGSVFAEMSLAWEKTTLQFAGSFNNNSIGEYLKAQKKQADENKSLIQMMQGGAGLSIIGVGGGSFFGPESGPSAADKSKAEFIQNQVKALSAAKHAGLFDLYQKFETSIVAGSGGADAFLDYTNALQNLSGLNIPSEAIGSVIADITKFEESRKAGAVAPDTFDYNKSWSDDVREAEAMADAKNAEIMKFEIDALSESQERRGAEIKSYLDEYLNRGIPFAELDAHAAQSAQRLKDYYSDSFNGMKEGFKEFSDSVGDGFQQMKTFGLNVANGLGQGFSTFFFDVLDGRIKSTKDAFISLAKTIANVLQQAASIALGQGLAGLFSGAIGGAAGAGAGSGSGSTGSAPGLVIPKGPGIQIVGSPSQYNNTMGGNNGGNAFNFYIMAKDAADTAKQIKQAIPEIINSIQKKVKTTPGFSLTLQGS